MLTQILLCAGILAIWYVLYWAVRNDSAQSIDDQKGLIRMRRPTPDPGRDDRDPADLDQDDREAGNVAATSRRVRPAAAPRTAQGRRPRRR